MEFIGLTGAILGIINVTTACISSLAEIRQRFKSANLNIELLSGQLVTVKAALGQIHNLIDGLTDEEQHYQLTLDLGVGINCCNLLIRVIEEQISQLQYSDADELEFNSKVKLLLESKGIEECLTRLDHQINALNLLITAFQSRTPKGQQSLLKRQQSRKVFEQLKDDSTSLIVLCDSASFATKRSGTTTTTSKLSMNFAFGAQLLQAKAYKSSLRSLMRKNLYPSRRFSPEVDGEQTARPKKIKTSPISLPDNPVHMIHVGYDTDVGTFTGLPRDWARSLHESMFNKSDTVINDRKLQSTENPMDAHKSISYEEWVNLPPHVYLESLTHESKNDNVQIPEKIDTAAEESAYSAAEDSDFSQAELLESESEKYILLEPKSYHSRSDNMKTLEQLDSAFLRLAR